MSRRFAFDARATMAAIAARRAGSAVAVPAVPAVLKPLQPPKPPPPGAELVLTRPTGFPDGDPVDPDAIEERAAPAVNSAPASYLDAWERLWCQWPVSVTGVAPLRTARDSWSGEDWRAFFDERAGIAEFDGGLPRQQAEVRAFTCCVAEWLNRNPVRSPPDRCLRCGEAERGHDPLLPLGTESTGHAWLHSRCWSGWRAGRQAEATDALEAMGIATPAGFPNDFDKKGGA
jgi:hypothetical protein